jgi:hypothetical protein
MSFSIRLRKGGGAVGVLNKTGKRLDATQLISIKRRIAWQKD